MNLLPQNPAPHSGPSGEQLQAIGFGVASFTAGCLFGLIANAPILVTGALCAITQVANLGIGHTIKDFATKKELTESSVLKISTAATAATRIAFLVAAVALGILGSTCVAVLGTLAVLLAFRSLYEAHKQNKKSSSPVEAKCEIKNRSQQLNDLVIQSLSQQQKNESSQIRYPLLETSNEKFDLKSFTKRPQDDDNYAGGNRVDILNSEGETISLPRTLYHILFIYFCFDSNLDHNQFPIIANPFSLRSNETLNPNYWYYGDREPNIFKGAQHYNNIKLPEISQQNLNEKILKFFKDKGVNKLTWNVTKNLIDELINQFELIYKQKDDNHKTSSLWYHFYTFCFNNPNKGETFKTLVTQAVAAEWTATANSEIFYRASHLIKDNTVTSKNGSHSLSFSSSLFSGIIFEGGPSGTCPYTYYNPNNQLYALEVPFSKVSKYFFVPPFKGYDLLPLNANGEFSHPRLKFFGKSNTHVSGIQAGDCTNQVAQFFPTDRIPDQKSYEAKVVKLFQKSIRLLAGSEALPNKE